MLKTRTTRIDPITTEVIGHHLVAIAEQMKRVIVRTARSPIIYEVLDFSTGVFDARGRLAAQAAGLSLFLGTLDFAVRAVLEKFGLDDIDPGDVFLTNDPYNGGGTHLNDVSVVCPVYVDSRLIGFVASRAHWTDVGGAVAMSVQTNAREIYGEGLVLPVIRVYRRGEPNRDVFDLMGANVRRSDDQFADLEAQIGAARLGARRLVELAAKYRTRTLAAVMEQLQRGNEIETRRLLREIPDGVYEGEDFLDDDGIGGGPTRIRVRAEKVNDGLRLDFAGSDPSTPSGYNMTYCSLVSACRVILKSITDPKGFTNDGNFRPLRVDAPLGSVVNARHPTPVSLYGEPARRAIDAVWKALAPALEGGLPAGHFGSIAGIAMTGSDDRANPPRHATFQGPAGGGWGASEGRDGTSALCCITNGDTRNTPIEMIEATAPLRVHRYALRPDSGGAGQWRGGLGTVCEYEVLTAAPFHLTTALGRTDFPPFGIGGGDDGMTNTLEIWRNGEHLATLARETAFPLAKGDRVVLRTGGGGGFGDPRRRDPAAVQRDVALGYTSAQASKVAYARSVERGSTKK